MASGAPGPLPAPASGASQGVLVSFAVILLIVVRSIYRNLTGVKVSHARTAGWTAFYFIFSGFFLATSFIEGVPVYYGALDAAALALAAYLSHRLSGRRLKFWRGPDGTVRYTGGIIVYLVYVSGLALRLGIEYLLVGPSAFVFAPVSGLGQEAILGLALADLLFSFGYGLLVGRNVRLYTSYTSILQGSLAAPSRDQ